MFRLSKVVAFGLVISVLFLLSGCNQDNNEQKTTQQQPQVTSRHKFESATMLPTIAKQNEKSVSAPIETPNLTYSNGIKVEYPNDKNNDKSNNNINYIKINGLANKDIENKINQRIYDECIALLNKGFPAYRGIRAVANDDAEVSHSYIYLSSNTNIANVFSVCITKETSINDKTKKQYNLVSDITTLNFNLKNGELITLSDLFADNCDYKKIINEQIGKYLLSKNADGGDKAKNSFDDMGMGQIEVISPFKGILDNQKYYIGGEDIYIVVDYNMPEFNTNFRSVPIVIDSCIPEVAKNFALFSRFETNDESIYDKSVKRQKNLRDLNYDTKEERIMYGSAKDLGLDYKDLDVSLFLQIPKQIADKNLESSLNKKYNEAKNKFIALIKNKRTQFPTERMMVAYTYYIKQIGKYLTEEENSSIYVSMQNDKDTNYYQTSNAAVYEVKTGKKLNLADVFKNTFDYKKAMVDIIKKNNYNKLTDQEIIKLIEQGNFRTSTEGIEISDTLSSEGKSINSYYISYSDLGYENLTIFD